ncbi:MAG: phospho-N-acetylmuramoyl-pentapeptide-transferase [Lachnospiraceae bacterium]|jgi:phospho-N-acetylmuramoyl-pentapeptide-transferase|nr:phospho-N-acetylmuramoyl-pentapeptide-transferase [Lachnospiraceae bacterium]MCI6977012.1 phospho-N-acetylmuramoyl-pentapeptide-transferase [Lachnospiraceae bacterium]MDD6579361.1 phospho-N-acetylmuramoyl-pentapeptide-transferase [Lachnospiraceae bacterium]MDD7223634.1 phospho-N-acetylmuramoyl-pentapeptide-transferase [Lachnospiraceae bacterium]MDY4428933.1 phospho-N-acetylmuramoyl-pentapeptide-transferase [Lachnospiraceae bacterium]
MIQNLDKSVYISLFLSFILTTAIAPIFIPFLLKLKVGQTVRDDGPESHLKKNGTPTMGGIIILIGFIGGSVIFCSRYSNTIPIMLMTIGFGLIGFIDDYIKVVLKRSMGLRAWQKLLLQIIVTAIFAVYLTKVAGVNLLLRVPFTNGYMLDLSWFSYVILFIAVLGTVNGANLTDGVDGLASSVTIVIAIYFAIIAVLENMGLEPTSLALIGSLLGFLVFNCYPAKVFMGDTGSLALGGYVIATAYMLNMPLYVIIVAVIYLVENISVMLQVSYFKITKGKRLFKMAPIHHHFEKSGWSETKVVTVFTIVSIFAAVIGYLGY